MSALKNGKHLETKKERRQHCFYIIMWCSVVVKKEEFSNAMNHSNHSLIAINVSIQKTESPFADGCVLVEILWN